MVEIENMKESSQSHALVNETLKQLEIAKRTVKFLRAADTAKAMHGYNKSFISTNNKCSCYKQEGEILENGYKDNAKHIETEIQSFRSALEIAETKYQEEQILNMVKLMNAYELIEHMKSESSRRESELEAELERKKTEVEELKAKLMDKENKFQGIVDENERLNSKLEKSLSLKSEQELKKQLKRLYECVAELKGDLMDKERTLLNILEENEMLKVEINKRFTHTHVDMVREEVAAELKAAKESVVEKLEAAEVINLEKEAELKRLKVQCDQWRKAAEAAAVMFSEEHNGKLGDRSMSFDSNYYNNNVNVQKNIEYSGFCEDDDDEFLRKKNGNVLKKIGVLWKKP